MKKSQNKKNTWVILSIALGIIMILLWLIIGNAMGECFRQTKKYAFELDQSRELVHSAEDIAAYHNKCLAQKGILSKFIPDYSKFVDKF